MSTVRAILLPLDESLFALPAEVVREVASLPPVTTVPTAPPALLGVFNLRGNIVPLVDTARLLLGRPLGAATYAVVVQYRTGRAALAVSALPSLTELGDPVQTSESAGATGSYQVEGRLVTLIDLDGLVTTRALGHEPDTHAASRAG